jgi:hypothetical protein
MVINFLLNNDSNNIHELSAVSFKNLYEKKKLQAKVLTRKQTCA